MHLLKRTLGLGLNLMIVAAITTSSGLVAQAKGRVDVPKPAKNVIVLISDGAGYNHVDAANLYQFGATRMQSYERFPFQFGMSTYSHGAPWNGPLGSYDPAQAWSDFSYVQSGATDSASAATAMSTGVKVYDNTIGVNLDRSPLTHVVQQAEANGKATGVVTSVEFSHATPAGFVAHNISRNNYAEIANEMIYSSAVDVIMGCGNPGFDDSGNPASKGTNYVGGAATWADLADGTVTGADANGDGSADDWTVIQSRADFQSLASGDAPARLIGIPQVYTTLQQARSGDGQAAPYVVPLTQSVPTLAEMTRAALNVVDSDPEGFFLMIEGGAVDWAAHANQSGRVIEEEIDFNAAVQAVLDWVHTNSNWGETLVIVTADHETGYLTGPDGAVNLVNNGAGNLPGMQWNSGDHTNSLIPLYAKGWGASLLNQFADETDPVRGRYIDNTELADLLWAVIE